MIPSDLQEDVANVEIIPAIRSDHSAITLRINGIQESPRGPSFWKFNASLLDDEYYVTKIKQRYNEWIEEGKEIQDPLVLWDFVKYKVRYETIDYSKKKAKERRAELNKLENNIKECQRKCDENPTVENMNDLDILQTEYDRHYEYIAQGAIIRSRVNWYEQGGRVINIF